MAKQLFLFVLKRVLSWLPTFWLMTALTFGISRCAGGDPILAKIPPDASPEIYAYYAQKMGFDKPIFYFSLGISTDSRYIPTIKIHGFDNQFHHYWVGILRGDWGMSLTDEQPILTKISPPLSISMLLGSMTFLFSIAVSVGLSVWLTLYQGRRRERWILHFLSFVYAIPTFLLAILGVLFLTNERYGLKIASVGLAETPSTNFWSSLLLQIPHLWLPMFCLSAHLIAKLTKQLHIALVNTLAESFITTAYGKGLSKYQTLIRHALPMALYVLVSAVGNLFPLLVMGSLVVEVIFNIMGIGRLSYEAILVRDYPLIMGVFWCAVLATFVGSLIADAIQIIVYPFEKNRA